MRGWEAGYTASRLRRIEESMPRYDFRCTHCGDVTEVTRPMSQAGEPVACPACGAATQRIYDTSSMIRLRTADYNISPHDPTYWDSFTEPLHRPRSWQNPPGSRDAFGHCPVYDVDPTI